MKLTWYTTASLKIESKDSTVLFDPFIPFSGSRVRVKKEDYAGVKDVLITHGHFDHIGTLDQLTKDVKIYGTKIVQKNCLKFGLKNVTVIEPYQTLTFGEMKITGYPTQHVKFDSELVKKTIFSSDNLRYAYNLPRFLSYSLNCPENKEILGYLIEAEEKKIFILGSLGLRNDVDYPTGMDVLVLPYQGNSNLYPMAKEIIEQLKPKKVFIDHYDNSFPPISKTIDISDICSEKNVSGLSYKETIEI